MNLVFAWFGRDRLLMATLIRAVEKADVGAIKRLATSNQMFDDDEVQFFVELIDGCLDGSLPDDRWLVAETGPALVGAAYVAPEPFGDRVWNLYFIATDTSAHGAGIGSLLLARVEQHLVELGAAAARALIVETSDTEQYAKARGFYERRGFDRESTIRDYYGPGDGKVTYWKAVNR